MTSRDVAAAKGGRDGRSSIVPLQNVILSVAPILSATRFALFRFSSDGSLAVISITSALAPSASISGPPPTPAIRSRSRALSVARVAISAEARRYMPSRPGTTRCISRYITIRSHGFLVGSEGPFFIAHSFNFLPGEFVAVRPFPVLLAVRGRATGPCLGDRAPAFLTLEVRRRIKLDLQPQTVAVAHAQKRLDEFGRGIGIIAGSAGHGADDGHAGIDEFGAVADQQVALMKTVGLPGHHDGAGFGRSRSVPFSTPRCPRSGARPLL